jgi:tetrahydromethanopterin S-methyltransferase subunit G
VQFEQGPGGRALTNLESTTYVGVVMADEPINLVLAPLNRLDKKFDSVLTSILELKQRVGSLETQVAQVHVDLAVMSNRIDRIDTRLDRIEKRLDLVDA